MKLIIIILLSICMYGCGNNYVPNDASQEQERERNLRLKQEIKDLLINTSLVNYDFEYAITLDDNNINYKGSIYDDIIKGVYTNNKTKINYQIENDIVYDLQSLENNINIYPNINTDYIDLKKIKDNVMTKKSECQFDEYYKCTTKEDNIKLSFWGKGRYITKIEINDNRNTYILNYSNYNKTNKIPKITFKVNYQETNNIRKTSYEKNDIKFNVIFYKIDNINYIINNKTIEYKDDNFYLDKATYIKNYLNTDNFKQTIKKYAFSNNFIIIYANGSNGYNYYLTLDKYANEILEQIPIKVEKK